MILLVSFLIGAFLGYLLVLPRLRWMRQMQMIVNEYNQYIKVPAQSPIALIMDRAYTGRILTEQEEKFIADYNAVSDRHLQHLKKRPTLISLRTFG